MQGNSVQQSVRSWWMARSFWTACGRDQLAAVLGPSKSSSPSIDGELQLRLSPRVSTTEKRGGNGLDDGTYAPILGEGTSSFLAHTVFCHTIGPLMRCGSAKRLL